MIERTVCTPRVHAALISNKHLLIQPRGNLNVNVEISAHEPESRGRKLLLIARHLPSSRLLPDNALVVIDAGTASCIERSSARRHPTRPSSSMHSPFPFLCMA
ncbi:hypothetical protein BJV77DRAFT_1044983 [Russula vinacea]|nr:hypothetical protein BJV77DRAFT_1044983 [Russula vinacea]